MIDDAEVALLAFALVDEQNARSVGEHIPLSAPAAELLGILSTGAAAARAVGPACYAGIVMASSECCELAERVESVSVAELVAVGTFPIVLSVFEDRARLSKRWAA